MDISNQYAESIGKSFKEEQAHRRSLVERRTPFGVKFLDDALGGIYPNDLIVVGAKPGIGKTEFVTGVAIQNVLKGKRVVLFALEAAKLEITTRLKYRLIANKFWAEKDLPPRLRQQFNFRNWYEGKCDWGVSEMERQVEEEAEILFKSFQIRYKSGDFTVQDLSAAIISLQSEADLFIIDHLHYIDYSTMDRNENQALEKTMKEIRDLSLMCEKPIILVSHVRKGDGKNKPLLPDMEDFHGSSNISKICTKALVLAPAYQAQNSSRTVFSTYMKILKNRLDGSVSRYTALVGFDIAKNEYESRYTLGRLNYDGTKFEALNLEETPEWALL